MRVIPSKLIRKYQRRTILVFLLKNVVHACMKNIFLSASPDGLVISLCHESSLLEIKCLAKHKENLLVSDCIATDKEFCLDKIFLLKSSHKYYAQVQMQMYIYRLKECHFVIWTPMFCTSVLVPYDDSFTKKCQRLQNSIKSILQENNKSDRKYSR